MPRPCSICQHDRRGEIDLAVTKHAEPYRAIAMRYRVSASALFRHLRNCIPGVHELLREAVARSEVKGVIEQMRELHQKTLVLLASAEVAGELDSALRAVREARNNLRLLAELDGTLSPQAPAGGVTRIEVVYVDKLQVAGAEPTRQESTKTIEGKVESTSEE